MIKEEAIEILSDMRAEYNIFSDDEEEATRYHALSWAIQALNERKTGKWVPKADQRYYCSGCNEIAPKGIRWNFCPNCGAAMKGVYDG